MSLTALLVSQGPPLHPSEGGDGVTIVVRSLLDAIPEGVEVLLAWTDDGRPAPSSWGPRVAEVHRLPVRPSWQGHLVRPALGIPALAWRQRSPAAAAVVRSLASRSDVAYLNGPMVFELARDLAGAGVPFLAHEIDPFSLGWLDLADGARGFTRFAHTQRARKARRLEERAARLANDLIVVNADDAAELTVALGRPVRHVPIGVTRVAASDRPLPDAPVVVFVGVLSYEPNIQSAEILVRDVLPELRRRVPAATVRLVGRNPGPRVRALEGPDVEIRADVPDVVAEYRAAAVAAFPGGFGRGTRGSVIQAMASGTPVVSSRISARGIERGAHLQVADDPADVAAAIAVLLEDAERWRRASEAAVRYASAWPTWEDSAVELWAMLARLPASTPRPVALRERGGRSVADGMTP